MGQYLFRYKVETLCAMHQLILNNNVFPMQIWSFQYISYYSVTYFPQNKVFKFSNPTNWLTNSQSPYMSLSHLIHYSLHSYTAFLSTSSLFYFFKKYFIYLFLERGEGKERGRESSIGCLSHAPNWGPGLQPRHVPWPGINPTTQVAGRALNPLSHTNQG